jgi:fumarate hydratase subunit beta
MIDALDEGKELPFEIAGSVIYYVGPTPARPGNVIGSAGPTTSYRMDKYAPRLLDLGLKGMIGKGNRSDDVIKSIIKNKAIYFAATGGVGALISKCIVKSEIIAYEELGPEAIRRLEVSNFPAIVVIDTFGKNLYEEGIKKYRIA